jgi:non-heme chloroperoxidase
LDTELVLIHGMWGTSRVWDCHRRYFESRGFRCRAPELRLHAPGSPSPPGAELGRTSVLDYVEDLSRELGGDGPKPVIVGHSMGGLLAQMLAERGLARALVLLSPAPPAGCMFVNASVLRCFRSIITTWGFWRSPAVLPFRDAEYALFPRMAPDRRGTLHAECLPESGRAVFEIGFSFLDGKRAARVQADRIACPVLVMAGSEDRITPASVVRKNVALYGGRAAYREWEGHSHWLLEEPGWEEIAEYAADWISRVTG